MEKTVGVFKNDELSVNEGDIQTPAVHSTRRQNVNELGKRRSTRNKILEQVTRQGIFS